MSFLTGLKHILASKKTKADYDKMLVATVERLKFNQTQVVDFLYLTHSKEDIALVRRASDFEFEDDAKEGYLFLDGEKMILNIAHSFKQKGVMINNATERLYYDISEQATKFLQSEGYYFEKKDVSDEESSTFTGFKILFHKVGNPQQTILLFFKKIRYQDTITIGMQYS
jgi:hypothetical protein